MGLIYLALYKGKGKLFNRLIRLWTRSKYSHCEIVMPDGRWLSASAMDGGVRVKRIELNIEHWDLLPVPWAERHNIEWLYQQHKAMGYDWAGIFFSQLLASGLHSKKRWFCSEFCAAALGIQSPQRYSPAQLGEVVQLITRASEVLQRATDHLTQYPAVLVDLGNGTIRPAERTPHG